MIRKPAFAVLIGLALAIASTGSASAFTRVTTVHGPQSGYTKSVNRYCFDGACYTESQLVGAYGNSFLRSRSCTRTAPGTYACEGHLSGSLGRSATLSGTVAVSP